MKYVTFGRTGIEVSRLGFGGAPIGYLGIEQKRVEQVLNLLLDNGVNLIDTAECYHGSEEAIGKAVGHRRDQYVLVTKTGHAIHADEGENFSPRLIMQNVERSLKRLRTDWLDAVLLHSCDLQTLKRGEALGALVKARDAGKVRFVGYSGDNEAALFAAGLPEVSVIETSISIADQANIDLVLPKARERNLGVIAKRPLANAAWRSPTDQPGIYSDYARPYSERLTRMHLNSAPGQGADNDDWPAIALRFTLSQPGVHTAIIGTTNPDHARANLAQAMQGPLPRQESAALRQAFERAEAEAGERWLALS